MPYPYLATLVHRVGSRHGSTYHLPMLMGFYHTSAIISSVGKNAFLLPETLKTVVWNITSVREFDMLFLSSYRLLIKIQSYHGSVTCYYQAGPSCNLQSELGENIYNWFDANCKH